ncbi:halocyanin domain-containing protein [Halalkalicoccus sp. NIPERK01]|uniref:halocyanin domain-containing protein n=1 Tax=Halalkalicoccus sp. NIPERK01 TaxID=3053469 RepID=UPI00256EB189|nr:halocyanin domain-containing protein [Halalkalicoccus sp. NIPERK01]MDL5363128.1 halocyanin domain-containing protein [Halalkalicoccus sp. NIPERK01]
MSARDQDVDLSRRRFLATTAGVTAGTALGVSQLARSAVASSESDLSTWFANTDNATEIVDWRGQSRVEVTVGATGNGGALAFEPAAIRVDPGTTVVWTWSGQGGVHNVVAKDGSFESEYYAEAAESFEFAPDAEGVIRYACAPHESTGMKGVLVVGDVEASLSTAAGAKSPGESTPVETFDGWLAGTDNYDGVVDLRGESEVTVKVGADGNGGAFAFEPAAIHIDPDTTVVWEWVGDKEYDVTDTDLGYHSDLISGPGHRFAMEFDGDGLSTYECTTYGEQGMRGVVLVGEGPVSVLSTLGLAIIGGGGALIALPPLYGLRLHIQDTTQYAR